MKKIVQNIALSAILLTILAVPAGMEAMEKNETTNTNEQLRQAVRLTDFERVKRLIEDGANANSNYYYALLLTTRPNQNSEAIAKYLACHGGGLETEMENGWCPIILCANIGNIRMVKFFIQAGVNPLATRDNQTARNMAKTTEIKAYLQLAEEFYALVKKQITFDAFAQKYLETKDNEKLTYVFDLLHLGTKEFVDQFIAFVNEKELPSPAGYNPDDPSDNKKRWFYLDFAKKNGPHQSYWIRECFGYLDGKRTCSRSFNQEVDNAIKKLPTQEERDSVKKEMNAKLQQKVGYLNIPKQIRMPYVKVEKEYGDVPKKKLIDAKISFKYQDEYK